jgi:hypothetical protein
MFALALPLVFGAARVAASFGIVDLDARSVNVMSLTADDAVVDLDSLVAPLRERDAFEDGVSFFLSSLRHSPRFVGLLRRNQPQQARRSSSATPP